MGNEMLGTRSAHDNLKRKFMDTLLTSLEAVIDRELARHEQGLVLPYEPSVVSFVRGVYFLTLAQVTNPVAHQMAWRALERIKEEDNSTTERSSSSTS